MAKSQLTPFLLAVTLMAPSALAGAAPDSWAIATAETIMKRNPGTPADRLARWSYWKGYTLYGFEMLWRSTGDQRYLDFIRRQMDPFVDEKGNLTPDVRLDSAWRVEHPPNVVQCRGEWYSPGFGTHRRARQRIDNSAAGIRRTTVRY
jgi:hypothetical protein